MWKGKKLFEEQKRKFADTLINHDQLNRLFMEFLFLSSAFYIHTNLSHMLGDRAVAVKLCFAGQLIASP
jgi:hypothetical protein